MYDACMADNSLAQYVAQHPKMMGVLFTICLLLAQAGPVIATDGCDRCGF